MPQAKWPRMDPKTGFVNQDWAILQLQTTMDYGHGNMLTTALTGALNYQVVHHLFPYVSQQHYPQLAPIIKAHCKEHQVEYLELPDFVSAFKNHIKHLSLLGEIHMDF